MYTHSLLRRRCFRALRGLRLVCLAVACTAVARADDRYEPNNTREQAFDLRPYENRWLATVAGQGLQADADWYAIQTAAANERVVALCRYANGAGNVTLTLYDSAGVQKATSRDDDSDQSINVVLAAAGTYYLAVGGANAGNGYDLWWNATALDDNYEQNDRQDQAYDLRSYPRTWLSTLRGPGLQWDDDFYRIRADANNRRVRVVCRFRQGSYGGDIDVYLLDAAGNTVGRAISTTDDETLDATVPQAGDYFVWVRRPNDSTLYDLWWDASATSGDDRYEPNDSREQAFDLSGRRGDWLSAVNGPGIARNADWYRVRLKPEGERLQVELLFTHASGNLDLHVYNASNALLAASASTSNSFERIDVVTASGGGDYFVRVTASGGYTGNGYDLRWQSSTPPPQTPVGVTASDGTFLDRVEVTWPVAAYAKGYMIYRHTTAEVADAQPIALVTTLQYSDPAVVAGRYYYYWVASSNALGLSAFSVPDAGYRDVEAPNNLQATQASTGVKLQWDPAQGASRYTVYRATVDNLAAAVLVTSSATGITYTDTAAPRDTQLYYWVASQGAEVGGRVSISVSGFFVPAPTGVNATDDTYTDRIRVTWVKPSGYNPPGGFRVYRGTSSSSASAVAIATVANTVVQYDDFTAVAGTYYYYWVTSVGALGESGFSNNNRGRRKSGSGVRPRLWTPGGFRLGWIPAWGLPVAACAAVPRGELP